MSMGFIVGPLIVFMIFVAPLWLLLHYRSKKHSSEGLSGDDHENCKLWSHAQSKCKSGLSHWSVFWMRKRHNGGIRYE